MSNINLQITLNVNEVNTVLESLSNMPYKQVTGLIYKIQTVAGQQIQKGETDETTVESINEEVSS